MDPHSIFLVIDPTDPHNAFRAVKVELVREDDRVMWVVTDRYEDVKRYDVANHFLLFDDHTVIVRHCH